MEPAQLFSTFGQPQKDLKTECQVAIDLEGRAQFVTERAHQQVFGHQWQQGNKRLTFRNETDTEIDDSPRWFCRWG